jgi:anti-sigma factor RsiW
MTTQISEREWEDLSAYLDGQLSPKESSRLEEKLQASADLRAALKELNQTRLLLRSQPAVRAPRNFLLTPKMVGDRRSKPRSFQLFPAMRLASALAVALFILVLAGDLLTGGRQPGAMPVAYQSLQMAAPAAEMNLAPTEAPAPQVEAPLVAPAVTEAPAEMQPEAKMAGATATPPAPTIAAGMLQDAGTGAEPYPPPGEGLAASESALAQDTATAVAPEPTPLQPEQANLAERNAVEFSATQTAAGEKAWPGWRFLEAALALLVVGTAVWAFYLRRSRGM